MVPINMIKTRKECNDQESIQIPNTFSSKTPNGKKNALKVTAPQSKHYKQTHNDRYSKPQQKHRLGTVSKNNTIGIRHGSSCTNIWQVPWEVLRIEAAVFNISQVTWRMLIHWKTMFNRYNCIKTENIWYISRYFLHLFCFAFSPMSRERNFHWLCSF